MKNTIKMLFVEVLAKIMEIGCVDNRTELMILVMVTLILSILPGPNILVPIAYGRVKSFVVGKMKKKSEA